jgi:transposase-like protein
MGKKVVRYSEAFKMKVISELESGELSSMAEARRTYDIGGGSTVANWLKKYGKNHLLGKVVKVETTDERDEKKRLKQRIEQLEKALADAKVKEVMSRAYFEVLCEDMGIEDVEGFKKKLDAELSEKPIS